MSEKLPDATYLRALAKEAESTAAMAQGCPDIAAVLIADAARLNEIADGLEWRPIAEAPKDRRILLSNGYRVCSGHHDSERGWMSGATRFSPTHWRPLPAPPVGTIGGG